MAKAKVFPLDSVRTDGWFERIGESIGSFQALCDIVGEAFFAFSMITGARITGLTVDRRTPDNTMVDFVVSSGDEADGEQEPQRLTLAEFRSRLVGALLTEDVDLAPPERERDVEGLQLYIGVRYLLLAPIYGYSLRRLVIDGGEAIVEVSHDGVDVTYELAELRGRIRGHVREELERSAAGPRGAIDLTKVAEAEAAAEREDHTRVLQLLGSWPAPLAIFLRTPEGHMLAADARALIAKGLGLLGTACARLGDASQGEEVLRLAVQYASDGMAGGDIFRRLGDAMLRDGRPGEAIGTLRRAMALGGPSVAIWPLLARAYVQRRRFVAAFACVREARAIGIAEQALAEELRAIEAALGTPLTAWRGLVASSASARS